MRARGWKYGEMMAALNPDVAARIGIGKAAKYCAGTPRQLTFFDVNRDGSELGEGEHTARIAHARPNISRAGLGAAR